MPFSTWKLMPCASAVLSYTLVQHAPESIPAVFSKHGYLAVFVLSFTLQLAAWAIYSTLVEPYCLTPLRKLPKPKGGNFITGHFKEVYMSGAGETEWKWCKELPNDGFIYYRSIFNRAHLILTSPAALEEILTRTYEFPKPEIAVFFAGKVLGMGLILSEGDVHKQQRRTFLPVFAPKHIRDMYPVFWAKSCEAVAMFQAMGSGPEIQFEAGEWAARTALDVITTTMMGKSFGAIADENAPLARTYRGLLQPARGYFILSVMKLYLPAFLVELLPVKWNKEVDDAVQTIRDLCREMLREKKRKLAEKTLVEKDFLSICVQYEEIAQISEDGVIDQLTNALMAGHGTVSVAITWVIYMLCLYPEWQGLLRDEIRTHFPSPAASQDTAVPTASDIENMPLLQAFINETLRWYPPVPLTMRRATKDAVVAGQFIPKGTSLCIPIKAVHRDTRLWGSDASQFRPRRWIDAEGKFLATGGVSTKYGNLAFLQGTRACVAREFAKAEMACVIGAWVGRFEFDLVDEKLKDESNMRISGGTISGKPLHGLEVKARAIQGW